MLNGFCLKIIRNTYAVHVTVAYEPRVGVATLNLALPAPPVRPFYKARAPVRLRLPVTQESTKSLKALLVLHGKTFELTKPSIMQVIILK